MWKVKMKANWKIATVLLGISVVFAILFLAIPRSKAATSEVHLNNSITTPYYLSQPNTTYILDEDITAGGTALVIGADNLIIDLNGHTITFGDTDVHVANADFEEGNGTLANNWDFSLAPHAQRVGTTTFPMIHNWSVKVAGTTAEEEIVSDWFTVSNPNRTYEAYCLSLGNLSAQRPKIKIENENKQIVATSVNPGDPIQIKLSSLGFGAGNYRLRLAFPAGAANTFVDLADFRPTKDAGIYQYPWQPPLPDIPATAIGTNIVVKNGTIKEGRGQGFASYAMMHSGTTRYEVDHINAYVSGVDSQIMWGYYAGGYVIHDSNLSNPKLAVLDRYDLTNLALTFGPNSQFYNNTLSIGVGGLYIRTDQGTGPVSVYNNTFNNAGNITNHYAITTMIAKDIHIYQNKFVGGPGIFFSSNTTNSEIDHNTFTLTATPCNYEYDKDLYTPAMRIYDYGDPADPNPTKNNKIHDNLINNSAHTYSQYPYCTPGAEGIKSVTAGPNQYYRNEIHVYREDTNANAVGFMAGGPDLSGISDNYIESNHLNITYGDHYAAKGDNGIFTSNTIVKGTNPNLSGYFPIASWWCCGFESNHQYVGTKLIGTKLEDFTYAIGASTGSVVHDIRWLSNIRVLDANGQTVDGANIVVSDSNGQQVFSGQTDSTGSLENINLLAQTQTLNLATRIKSSVPYTPHSFAISKTGLPAETKTISFDTNKEITVVLDGQQLEPSIISNIAVSLNRTDKTATVNWSTERPTTSYLEWGPNESYGKNLSNSTLTNAHIMTITNITPGDYHFRVSGKDSNQLEATSSDQAFFYLSDMTEVRIALSADKSTVSSGQIVTYSLNYINTLPGEIMATKIENMIPSKMSYVEGSASNGGVFDGSKVIWNLGTLAPAASGSVTFQVRVE